MIDAAKDFATLQAFIVDRLPEDERRAFEDRLAREPALVDELEQSLRMREGLRALRARGHLQIAAPQRRQLRVWIPALALAATVVLGLFLWVSRVASPAPVLLSSLESGASAGAAALVTAKFTFVSMRGRSVPDLDLPSSGMVEFRAAPSSDSSHFRLSLQRVQTGTPAEPVASLTGLVPAADGYVHFYADALHLAGGRYELKVQPESGAAAAEDVFAFNLRAGTKDLAP